MAMTCCQGDAQGSKEEPFQLVTVSLHINSLFGDCKIRNISFLDQLGDGAYLFRKEKVDDQLKRNTCDLSVEVVLGKLFDVSCVNLPYYLWHTPCDSDWEIEPKHVLMSLQHEFANFKINPYGDINVLTVGTIANLTYFEKSNFNPCFDSYDYACLNMTNLLLLCDKSFIHQSKHGCGLIPFDPGAWILKPIMDHEVWMRMRKKRFPDRRKSQLLSSGAGPFQLLERIIDNAFKIDLPGEYDVSAFFNVVELSPFDAGGKEVLDLRSNPPQVGGDDEGTTPTQDMDVLEGPRGLTTRARARKAKEALGRMETYMLRADTKPEDLECRIVICTQPIEAHEDP